jgi:hypothetical protein
MVGIADEPPRQLTPSVEIATVGFCYPDGIRQSSSLISSMRLKTKRKIKIASKQEIVESVITMRMR